MTCSLVVVVVNYKTPNLTLGCLTSLARERAKGAKLRVVLVDAGSTDDSKSEFEDAIQEKQWHSWVRLLPLSENRGFAYGNNVAIWEVLREPNTPDYVMLLNPDTVVRSGAVEALLEFMDANPEALLAGPCLEDLCGTPQVSAFRFPSILSEFEEEMRLGVLSRLLDKARVAPEPPQDPCKVDWLSGACLMVRREVFEHAGLLDEEYFLYYEDVDFCRAAHRMGAACWYVPTGRVAHIVSQSTHLDHSCARRPSYWFDARRRYFIKNHGRAYACLADLARISGHTLWQARRLIQGKEPETPHRFLGDLIRHSALLRGA